MKPTTCARCHAVPAVALCDSCAENLRYDTKAELRRVLAELEERDASYDASIVRGREITEKLFEHNRDARPLEGR